MNKSLFWKWIQAIILLPDLIYIPLFEEKSLIKRFGADYELYKKNVLRWIPRIKPWNPP